MAISQIGVANLNSTAYLSGEVHNLILVQNIDGLSFEALIIRGQAVLAVVAAAINPDIPGSSADVQGVISVRIGRRVLIESVTIDVGKRVNTYIRNRIAVGIFE